MSDHMSFREFQNAKQELDEETSLFPPTLLLRRVAIRQYPHGKVAVYYADSIRQYFTYPSQFE